MPVCGYMSRHDTVLGGITGWFSMPGYVRIGVPSDFIHSGVVAVGAVGVVREHGVRLGRDEHDVVLRAADRQARQIERLRVDVPVDHAREQQAELAAADVRDGQRRSRRGSRRCGRCRSGWSRPRRRTRRCRRAGGRAAAVPTCPPRRRPSRPDRRRRPAPRRPSSRRGPRRRWSRPRCRPLPPCRRSSRASGRASRPCRPCRACARAARGSRAAGWSNAAAVPVVPPALRHRTRPPIPVAPPPVAALSRSPSHPTGAHASAPNRTTMRSGVAARKDMNRRVRTQGHRGG